MGDTKPMTQELMDAERDEQIKQARQHSDRIGAMVKHIEAELLKKSFTFKDFCEVVDNINLRVRGSFETLTFDEITKRYVGSTHSR